MSHRLNYGMPVVLPMSITIQYGKNGWMHFVSENEGYSQTDTWRVVPNPMFSAMAFVMSKMVLGQDVTISTLIIR